MYGDYIDLEAVKRVLVIKLRNLGDLLLTTPVFRVLKKSLKDVEIDAYINKSGSSILENNPDIERIISFDRDIKRLPFLSRMREETKLLREFRRSKYDLVINLTEGDRGALVARFSGARFKVGIATGSKRKKSIYSHLAKVSENRHAVEGNLDLLRRIGIFPSEEDKRLFLDIPKESYRKVRGLVGEGDFVLIHPSSRWRFKCWPRDKFREVIVGLVERGKRVVVVTGKLLFEREMADDILRGIGNVLNLSSKLKIKELAALIDMSEVLFSMDSFPHHLASFLKKREVVLFGPSSEVKWGPWKNPNAEVIKLDYSCRPCCMDGCGGSKISSCIADIPTGLVLEKLL